MALILVGMNHRTAPLELREQLSISETLTPEILARLQRLDGVRGASLLSTCNRVETVVSTDNEDVADGVVALLSDLSNAPREEVEKHVYVMRNRDVIRHLFRVASGLDSMVVGEPQIGGQVRSAFQQSNEASSLDPLLRTLFEHTLRVAKKVRSETGIGESAVSIPYAAVELARKIFGDLTGLQVLLLGAGEVGELTAQNLCGTGIGRLVIANRAYDKAVQLADKFQGEPIPYESVASSLDQFDIIVTSTNASHHVVTASDVSAATAGRRKQSLFFIDLSVPRNLDPEIGKLDGVYLYNIDDLQEIAESNLEKRQGKAALAEEIVEGEVDGFLRRQQAADAIPTIVELQSRLEEIRTGELDRCLRKLGPITTEQRAAIEMLSTSIINKVLHYPIVRLKESASEQPQDRETLRQTIRNIFGLR
ncbi:MAG TPA: glutamyl-tRNA reductase [Thermoanaerobaculia bacterium]|nr:glutamyl-tRNA reductase [Thermoanaerobaculia bacterium]